MNDAPAFARLVEALRPWLPKLVIVGGWAHRLHRLSPDARTLPYRPVATRDADLAFAAAERFQGRIADALKAAGFQQELLGDHTPPAMHFTLGSEERGFYAEFLAPLTGSGTRRGGERDATVAKAGVVAQKLRYVDLLLISPIVLTLSPSGEIPVEAPAEILVANPAGFIAQKLLIRPMRTADKRAQDILYIHDTLELFSHVLPRLGATWRDIMRRDLPRKTAERVEETALTLFRAVTDDVRSAARIPQDRVLDPERVRAVCAYGLEILFRSSAGDL